MALVTPLPAAAAPANGLPFTGELPKVGQSAAATSTQAAAQGFVPNPHHQAQLDRQHHASTGTDALKLAVELCKAHVVITDAVEAGVQAEIVVAVAAIFREFLKSTP